MRGDPFSTYVMSLIESRGLTRIGIASNMHTRYPARAESTLSEWVTYGYEVAGEHFESALRGEEPDRTYLLLFMEALSPAPEEMDEMQRMIREERPDFDFTLDEEALRTRREPKGKELTYGQKLEALKPEDRDGIKGMIDDLYREVGGKD